MLNAQRWALAAVGGEGRLAVETEKSPSPVKCQNNAARTHRQLHAVLGARMDGTKPQTRNMLGREVETLRANGPCQTTCFHYDMPAAKIPQPILKRDLGSTLILELLTSKTGKIKSAT